MVKKAPNNQGSSKRLFDDLNSMSKPKRNKSASDERMKSGSSENDTMSSPEYNQKDQLLANTMRVYEELHPSAQFRLNKFITAIEQDLQAINFKNDNSKSRIISELRSLTQAPSIKDSLVQSLIPFPVANSSLQRDNSLFSVEESKNDDRLINTDQISTDNEDDDDDDEMMTTAPFKSRNATTNKLTKGILKKQRQGRHQVNNKKVARLPVDVTALIEKISTLTVQEELAQKDDLKIELVFFLTETYEKNFNGLCKEIKSSFFSPFDLNKIEIFTSNHQRILIGRVYHHCKGKSPLSHSKSPLFTTEINGKLYSRELKGIFKVFSDIQCVTKLKELLNYY